MRNIDLGGTIMDAYIKKIYDMLYSPIISPYNLLENAKLDNYSYVKYYANNVAKAVSANELSKGIKLP